jgi:hypothetical protein
MVRLDVGTYIEIFARGCPSPMTQKDIGLFLFSPIMKAAEDFDLPMGFGGKIDTEISDLVRHRSEMHVDIKTAVQDTRVEHILRDYFDEMIAKKKLNQFTKDQMVGALKKAVMGDENITDKKKFTSLLDDGREGQFLVELFLYSLFVKNKYEYCSVNADDIPLLTDFKNTCPLCKKEKLIDEGGSKNKNYEIVHIYPSDLSEIEKLAYPVAEPKNIDDRANLIPLCRSCARKYQLMPNFDDYQRLLLAKETAEKNRLIERRISQEALDKQITEIIHRLGTAKLDDPKSYKFVYEPHKVEDKIKKENFLLRAEILTDCSNNYGFIRLQMSEVDQTGWNNFSLIASQIGSAYLELEKLELSQEKIYFQLARWILERSLLDDSFYDASCVMVSFFVHNCEVFHALSK